ncbi:MAG: AI-2E family transporter [Bacteroidales bacterium]
MDNKKKIIGLIAALLVIVAIFYYLSDLIIYTMSAFVISMMGRPFVKLLNKKLKFPNALASAISLCLIVGVISLIFYLVLPLFIKQAQQIANLDYTQISNDTFVGFQQITQWLADKGIYIDEEKIRLYVINWGEQMLDKINIQNIISNAVNWISSLSVAVFSIIFIAFFFLKDEKLFKKILFLFIPERYTQKGENILKSSEHLLTRYFVGLSIELVCMMTLISLGLWAFGVENALLYGCLGGLLNIIPYVGPVIGACTACFFTLLNNLEYGFTIDLFWLIVKVIGVFVGCNLLDNMVLQVTIYSNSVKAHPLEIFFVIMIAGTLSGIFGMILAIPIYTVLRIIAKEFFKSTKFVDQLTKNI